MWLHLNHSLSALATQKNIPKNKYIYYYFLSLYPETIINDKHIKRPLQMINIEP